MVARRLRAAGYEGEIVEAPLSDGGEGAAATFLPGARRVSPGVYARGDRRLVVSSEVVGFSAFDMAREPLMERSSIALGKAVERGVMTDIAVGGTAVADGGAGFLQGLGVKFYDSQGRLITEPPCPSLLKEIASADLDALAHYRLRGIVDVRASLCSGALSAIDFARQKAAPGEDLSALPDALGHLHSVLGGRSEWDGAGGGLGYALASVIGCGCVAGGQAAVDGINVDWSAVKLVVTGEGCVDCQTALGGKAVDAVWRKASELGIPTLIIYGRREGALPYENMAQINNEWEILFKNLIFSW